MAVQIHYKDVLDAADRIRDDLKETPLLKSPKLSEELGMEIYLKMELTLPTGSIKDRGACYIMKSLSQEDRRKGVIAVVGGNLALALAYQGKLHNVPVTLVLPRIFRIEMISKLKEYGATVEQHSQGILEAKKYAMTLAEERGLRYINSYDDPLIIAGQGTAALEIINQMDELGVQLDAVIIPVGGGGLLAGMAVTLKHLRPDVKVIAVESESCDSFSAAMRAGRPVKVPDRLGLAGGLRAPMAGTSAFETSRNNVDEVCVVDEDSIACSISKLFEVEEITVEGAGACGFAACLSGQLHQHLSGKNVVVMLTGKNMDEKTHEKGLKGERSIYGDKKDYYVIGPHPILPQDLPHSSITTQGGKLK